MLACGRICCEGQAATYGVLKCGARYAYMRQGIWPPHVGDEAAPDEMFLRSNMSLMPAANPDAPVVMLASNRGRTVRISYTSAFYRLLQDGTCCVGQQESG